MTLQDIFDIIKKTVLSILPDARVLLFGSHARGDYDSDSDYDLLVITSGNLSRNDKLHYSGNLHKAIVKAIHAPVDLLLYSEDEITTKRELPGHIVRAAVREGISL